jgi:polysaccharide chain length determinant protein (PEP-CTERM system associated)
LDTASVERLREIWSRRGGLAVFALCVVLTAAGVLAWSLPDLYRASVTLLVENPGQTAAGDSEARLLLLHERILTRGQLEELILRFDLYPEPGRDASLEPAVARFRRDLSLETRSVDLPSGPATVALELGFRAADPAIAAALANRLADLYVEEDRALRSRRAADAAESLRSQVERIRERLEELERRRRELDAGGETNENLGLATLARLTTQLGATSEARFRAQERRGGLLRQLAELEPGAGDAQGVSERLAGLRRELAQLRRRFSDKYPDVMRMKTQIAELERQVAAGDAAADTEAHGVALPLRQALAEAEREIGALKGEESRLRERIAALESSLARAPQLQQSGQELIRDHGVTRELYQELLKRYEQARSSGESGEPAGPGLRIVEAARPPREPAAPDRLRIALSGALLALGVAAGVVVLWEHADTRLHTVDDVRAFTRVPVLASVPRIATRADDRRLSFRKLLQGGGALIVYALVILAVRLAAAGNQGLVALLTRGQ